jgi:P63C domain
MSNKILKSTHEGILPIGDTKLNVAVLANKQRIISQNAVFLAFGRPVRGSRSGGDQDGSKLPGLIDAKNLKPFISNELMGVIKPIQYVDKNGKENRGYDSSILALICEVYLDALKEHAKDGKITLTPKQMPNAIAAEALSRVLMKVSIIALIDEVTGYQDIRVKDELERIFNELLLEKAKKYIVTFPLELYKQMFRLNGWEWKPENAQKRPGVLGTWTNDLIYDRMAPGLLSELERRNPKNEKGYREHKHFQFLTEEVGEPKLREYFGGLLALARANTSWKKFYEMVEKAFPKPPEIGEQLRIGYD